MAQGKTNTEIGSILGMRPATVKKHLQHVYEKLGVETRIAAVTLALGSFQIMYHTDPTRLLSMVCLSAIFAPKVLSSTSSFPHPGGTREKSLGCGPAGDGLSRA